MSGTNKPAMKRIGYFGEEGYMTIGDPYKTKVVESMPRYKDAQFQTNPTFKVDPKHNLGNGMFSKHIALFAGEPYVTLEQYQRREKNKLKSKQVSEEPFRPANPSKLASNNFGSFYGTVGYVDKKSEPFPNGGKILYLPQGDGAQRKKKGEVVNEGPNIITNPPKRGTYGFANTTMGVPFSAGERRAWKGVAGEYAYIPDPYDAAKIAEKEYKEKIPKNISETPFRPANPGKVGGAGRWGGHRAMSDHPKDCGGTINPYHIYIPTGTEKKKTKADVEEERWKDPYDRAPFKPSQPAKKGGPGYWGCKNKAGGCGTLSGFPTAMPDPYDTLRYKILQEKKQRKEELGALAERPSFNSASFGRSKCTPSIFVMNIRV